MHKLKLGVLKGSTHESETWKYFQEFELFEVANIFKLSTLDKNQSSPKKDTLEKENIEEYLNHVDAVYIQCASNKLYKCAEKAIRKSKHVIFDDFFEVDIEEVQLIYDLAKEAGVKVLVLNKNEGLAVIQSLKEMQMQPAIVQIYQNSLLNDKRKVHKTIYNNLIFNTNIILKLYPFNIKHIHTSQVSLIGEAPDTLQILLEFDNKSSATMLINMTTKPEEEKHWMYLFENKKKTKVDLQAFNITTNTFQEDLPNGYSSAQPVVKKFQLDQINPITYQLQTFAHSILEDGNYKFIEFDLRLYQTIQKILDKIHQWDHIRL